MVQENLLTISEFCENTMSSHPIVVGITMRTTVIFVPKMFLKIPEIAVATVAPSAINATIQENSLLVTGKLPSPDKRVLETGLDQPSEIPKMKAPP